MDKMIQTNRQGPPPRVSASYIWLPISREDPEVSAFPHPLVTEKEQAKQCLKEIFRQPLQTEGQSLKIFTHEEAEAARKRLKDSIIAPVVGVNYSILGGPEHGSMLVAISLDPREAWENGIFENSRYARFHLSNNGTLEKFSGWQTPKFRKSRVKSLEEAISKLNSFINAGEPIITEDLRPGAAEAAEKDLPPWKTAPLLRSPLIRNAQSWVEDRLENEEPLWFESFVEFMVSINDPSETDRITEACENLKPYMEEEYARRQKHLPLIHEAKEIIPGAADLATDRTPDVLKPGDWIKVTDDYPAYGGQTGGSYWQPPDDIEIPIKAGAVGCITKVEDDMVWLDFILEPDPKYPRSRFNEKIEVALQMTDWGEAFRFATPAEVAKTKPILDTAKYEWEIQKMLYNQEVKEWKRKGRKGHPPVNY